MIRVVLDTNVFVSSFFGGNPRKIIDLWKNGKLKLCLSGVIVDEYIKVLGRLGLQDTEELRDLLNIFAQGYNLIFSCNVPAIDIISLDPDDNKFIECAVALKAGFIISGDKHLKTIRNYMGIKILTPKEFLDYHDGHLPEPIL